MKKILLLILILPLFVNAQINDDFSDGNFISNPTWNGDIGQFEINSSEQLHLHSLGADTSYLSTTNALINNTQWQLWLKLSFNTSANNNARVYLVSDQNNIEDSLDGYFVQVGQSNGDDSIALYKQTGATIEKLIPGTVAYTGNSTNPLSIKVTRDNAGNWKLYSDTNAGTDFQLEGACFDTTFTTTSFFGIFCKYTSSNATKFYFDSIYVGPIIVDTISPYVTSVTVVSSTQLDVLFSENILDSSSVILTNYNVNNGINNPDFVFHDIYTPAIVHLYFFNEFTDSIENTLNIKNIKDLSGNVIDSTTIINFTYYKIKLLGVNVLSSNHLSVMFSKVINDTIAEDTLNYFVNNGIGYPFSAVPDLSDSTTVDLYFSNEFSDGVENIITVENIKDINGDTITSTSLKFVYYNAKPYDIVINEIMTDENPAPAVLPEYDYVELFNTTPFPVNLNGWTITLGSTIKTFPDVLIQADSFLILCHEDADSLFSQYGQVLGFSSFSVNNETSITLKNTDGNIIHSISYTTDWYNDENKEDGGWSLEQIDPANPCGCVNNWKASVDPSGGTPGRKNSVYASNPDNINPKLLRVSVLDSNEIQVYFSETLDTVNLKNAGNYTVDNSIGVPNNVTLVEPDFNSVILKLTSSLNTGTIYTLTITDTITDCVGNIVALNSEARFAIPETAEPLDIVINEVLSNPKDDGKDFVEIYNRSDKVIDLKELTLSSMDETTSTLTDIKDISGDGFLIFPAEYYVLTTDPDIVKSQYYTSNSDGFIKMESLPGFSNDQGIVVIADKSQTIIDKLTYTEDMQFALLNTSDGVSLERLNFDRPTQDKTNWHSAAESVGFATPAYKNSQWTDTEQTNDEIIVYPEIFSPDQDGYNDVLNINYHFDEPGYVANIVVYDSKGRLIKNLVKSELLATNGTISWDGINEDNGKAVIGIYIIYIEVFNLNGDVKHYKRTCVLGKKL